MLVYVHLHHQVTGNNQQQCVISIIMLFIYGILWYAMYEGDDCS